MKQPCKHINEGSSCSLNNNCTYPECEKVPSAEEILIETYGCVNMNDLKKCFLDTISIEMVKYSMREHTRLHLEALADEMCNPFDHRDYYTILSDYLTKNKLK